MNFFSIIFLLFLSISLYAQNENLDNARALRKEKKYEEAYSQYWIAITKCNGVEEEECKTNIRTEIREFEKEVCKDYLNLYKDYKDYQWLYRNFRILYNYNKYLLVQKRNLNNQIEYQFINNQGQIKFDSTFTSAEPFDLNSNLALVETNYQKYYLDIQGHYHPLTTDFLKHNIRIQAIDLSNRNLDSIPEIVFTYPQLEILILSNNNIQELPTDLTNSNLKYLIIDNNEKLNIDIELLLKLDNLSYLDITSCNVDESTIKMVKHKLPKVKIIHK